MCKDAIYYNGTQLWSYYDNKVTSNSLVYEYFTYQTNKNIKLQPPRFKFAIYGNNCSISVTLGNAELYRYYYELKKCIVDKLNNHIAEINRNKEYKDGFVFYGTKGNNLYTTIIYNELLDSPCVRIMIGEKEKSILDTDKIYIPIIEFISLYIMIDKSFNNYISISQNVTMLDYFRKLEEKLDTSFSSISNILIDLNISNIEKQKVENNNLEISEVEIKEDIFKNNDSCELIAKKSGFDNFLDENIDKMELDLPKQVSENVKTEKDIVLVNSFQKKILKNNFKNLELIITNCVNSNVPLDAFVKTVYETSGIDLYSNFNDYNKYCLNYIISQNIKYFIGGYISKKQSIPKSINPIIVDITNRDNMQEKIDCMYFLLMSYVYFTKVKNDLSAGNKDEQSNKSFVTYCLKTITSPFVFTYILDIDKNILCDGVIKLYNNLKFEGFFDSYNDELYKENSIKIEIAEEYIKDQIIKIYDNVQKFRDKLTIENFFNKKFMKLNYEDFKTFKEYNVDYLKNILVIEGYYWNNKIEEAYNNVIKSTDGISKDILKKYGIKNSKFDNSILLKFINNRFKDFNDLEQIKNINNNVYDILDKIDIKNYPLDILKCLYFWNVETLPKNITYDSFVNMIDCSNLDSNMLISMIYDKQYKKDDNFYNSLVNSTDYE